MWVLKEPVKGAYGREAVGTEVSPDFRQGCQTREQNQLDFSASICIVSQHRSQQYLNPNESTYGYNSLDSRLDSIITDRRY